MSPIVLQHGLFGYAQIELGKLKISYFHKIDRALEKRGHKVILSRVHPTSSIEQRAEQLKKTILESVNNERVIILAHSMGGLDARYMIRFCDMAERVAALVTLSTPHRGSPYADWVRLNLGQRMVGAKLVKFLGLDLRAITDLSTQACLQFNKNVPDHPEVRYFSVSAARPRHRVPAFMMHSHKLVTDLEGPNDGIVSVASATWGEHLDTWPADHMHMINHRLVPEIRDRTGDIVPYYLKMLERILEPQMNADERG